MKTKIRMWIFPGADRPFPYHIVGAGGEEYLPSLPSDDPKAPEHLDLEFLQKYVGTEVEVYIQGIKQTDKTLNRVEKVNGIWEFETNA